MNKFFNQTFNIQNVVKNVYQLNVNKALIKIFFNTEFNKKNQSRTNPDTTT